MKWSYKTVHFELKKEGLLGGGFLDETEVEQRLNEYGRSGWELTSVIEVQDGIIAFFKQPLFLGLSSREPEPAGEDQHRDQVIEEPYDADHYHESDGDYRVENEPPPAAAPDEERSEFDEEHEFGDRGAGSSLIPEDDVEEPVHAGEDDEDPHGDELPHDEEEDHPEQRGIGAIRIE